QDRLDADLRARERGVAAAIVELDALADTVGAAAKDDDLLAIARISFAIGRALFTFEIERADLVGRVHVWRSRAELGGAAVDALELRAHAEFSARGAHVALALASEFGEARIGE